MRVRRGSTARLAAALGVFAFACAVLLAGPAFAQTYYFPPEYAALCTYNPNFNIQIPATGTGIITVMVASVSNIINNLAFALYSAIIANVSFQVAIRAMMTIYVMVFGILFTFGMTQITMMDFLIRAVKFGIIAILVSPGSWNFFYNYIGAFFYEGTNWLIAVMSSLAVGGAVGNTSFPFKPLDDAIATLTSSRMFVTVIATFFTGPYGLIIGGLILAALGTFAAAVFQAMWVYLMSLVVRAFLFALAPLFMSFMLFERTRHLFQGWINAIVSASLQPIFLFAFFAFFSMLVAASLAKLIATPVCWTPAPAGEGWAGSSYAIEMWRFMKAVWIPDAFTPGGGYFRWERHNEGWSFNGTGDPGSPAFPLSLMDVLIFLLITQLAWRFNGIVANLAKDIAGASLSLNVSGAFSNMVSPGRGRLNMLQGMTPRPGGGAGGAGGAGGGGVGGAGGGGAGGAGGAGGGGAGGGGRGG